MNFLVHGIVINHFEALNNYNTLKPRDIIEAQIEANKKYYFLAFCLSNTKIANYCFLMERVLIKFGLPVSLTFRLFNNMKPIINFHLLF
jgi:hypothetical protein